MLRSSSKPPSATLMGKVLSTIEKRWRRLNPHRQDRFAMLAPVVSVLLFFLAIVAAIAYLRMEEYARNQEAVQHDIEYTQQQLRLRLVERQEQFSRIAREIANYEMEPLTFKKRAKSLMDQDPTIEEITWFDDQKKVRSSYGSESDMEEEKSYVSGFTQTKELRSAVYAQHFSRLEQTQLLQLFVPILRNNNFVGVVMCEYSIEAIYRKGIPPEIAARYAVSILGADDKVLAGSDIPTKKILNKLLPWSDQGNEYTTHVSPAGGVLKLRAQAYRASLGFIGRSLFWLVAAISLLTAWMLIANWRHTRRRVQAQQALISETNFRRAMENSMLTGMRAMDLQGRITYVNAAFCQMTGWDEPDLVGKTAPFPYWPDSDREALSSRLAEEMTGKQTPGGFQVKVRRKDGSMFDARIYLSPLIDSMGTQTGWMTSMTDITEPNRVREQLSASHERFTAVLEALDASISVAPLGSDELVFANRLYRLWFGTLASGHLQLVAEAGALPISNHEESMDDVDSFAGLPTSALPDSEMGNAEIYLAELDKWLEVRTRYLSWVDGRIAQIVIATDITARRLSEEREATQTERAQSASRLITMGEMASSVAHELNQPLTAINNYCNGLITRLKTHHYREEEILGAIEKTAKQAQRAGQIIQRIRSFVKRSEPNRTPSDVSFMVAEAVELSEIGLRRFNVRLTHYVASRLPPLNVDPILIEQVLVNLLRNAAESIDLAMRKTSSRLIELRVLPRVIEGKQVIEFSVQDTGSGLSSEVMSRLYEAFFSTKTDGMGIGLSLCRSIVESHMGRMSAENIYNAGQVSGCRFSFWIPLSVNPVVESPQPSTN